LPFFAFVFLFVTKCVGSFRVNRSRAQGCIYGSVDRSILLCLWKGKRDAVCTLKLLAQPWFVLERRRGCFVFFFKLFLNSCVLC
jgi:hypothetical protein